MHINRTIGAVVLSCTWVFAHAASAADLAKVKHPFLLWTSEDLRSLRKKIETQPWARKAYEEMVASTEREGTAEYCGLHARA